jgi:hypothetical protein
MNLDEGPFGDLRSLLEAYSLNRQGQSLLPLAIGGLL